MWMKTKCNTYIYVSVFLLLALMVWFEEIEREGSAIRKNVVAWLCSQGRLFTRPRSLAYIFLFMHFIVRWRHCIMTLNDHLRFLWMCAPGIGRFFFCMLLFRIIAFKNRSRPTSWCEDIGLWNCFSSLAVGLLMWGPLAVTESSDTLNQSFYRITGSINH